MDYDSVIQFADEILTRKDPYNHHGQHVEKISAQIATALQMKSAELRLLSYAARLHDVGKILLTDMLLNYPRRLTSGEREQIKTHAHVGYEIVMALNYHPDICEAIKHHHEHWDGSGYLGMRGQNIPLFARIICIADVWDAITNDRAYRKAMHHADALMEMNRNIMWFDPRLFAIFLSILKNNNGRF